MANMATNSNIDIELWLVQERHLQLQRDGAANRIGRLSADREDPCGGSDDGGLRVRLGQLLVSAGRALGTRDGACNDPCPDGAR
jgi:hypothetical protein